MVYPYILFLVHNEFSFSSYMSAPSTGLFIVSAKATYKGWTIPYNLHRVNVLSGFEDATIGLDYTLLTEKHSSE